jgi:hypothetical protein
MMFTTSTALLALAAAGSAMAKADPYNPTSFVPVQMTVKASTTTKENLFVSGSLPQLTSWSTGGVSPSSLSSSDLWRWLTNVAMYV